ncbi:UNVERIFIED_CONTAM: hypothetical protein RMT77_002308 [Armadillidium vulgare]
MTSEATLEIEAQQECWIRSLFRWCPTSTQLLREAEKNILRNLKCSYRGQYVNIGTAVGSKDNEIWTVIANEESDKTPLVMIHGFGSGSALWCLNFDSLATYRPVYAFDIIGFGRSSRPTFNSEALEAEGEFINSIEAWRSSLKLEKFILLGHSFGGFLAASYAIKHPDRISHLILADPWGFPERPLDVAERYNLPLWVKAIGAIVQPFNPLFLLRTAGPLGPKIVQKTRPDLIRKFSGLVKDADEVIPNYLYHCNAQNPSGESAFHSVMSGFGWAKYPMIHRMDSLRKEVPLTLIYGARSWVDRDPGFQIKYMRQESYVEVQIIQGAGHHVYADRASVFNSMINKIGIAVDKGELPNMEGAQPQNITPESERSHGEMFNQFMNVGKDTVRDENLVNQSEKEVNHS